MITIVGCGTLGSRVAHNLKDQKLALIDHDVITKENLQTQKYTKRDVGTQKVYALMRRIPTARTFNTFLDATNLELLKEAEVVIDCTDNLLTRELIDSYCHDNGIALVHAAAAKDKGIVGLFCGTHCLRAVYDDKISLENCRGNEIDTAIADTLAQEQARLAQEVLAGEERAQLHLVRADGQQEIGLPQDTSACKQEAPRKDWYITWCPQAQCLSAKRLRPLETRERDETISGVHAHVHPDGEIHFSGTEDIDALRRAAQTIYNS